MKHRTDRRLVRQMEREIDSGRRQIAGVAVVDVCHRKSRWRTKTIAKEAADRMTSRYGEKTYAYECPECRNWHLTTLAPEEFRARQRKGSS